MNDQHMDSTRKTARLAGLLYLLASLPGAFALLYVPSKVIVTGDATATADRIRASGTLLRMGIGAERSASPSSSSSRWSSTACSSR